jgi:hypothetical protein
MLRYWSLIRGVIFVIFIEAHSVEVRRYCFHYKDLNFSSYEEIQAILSLLDQGATSLRVDAEPSLSGGSHLSDTKHNHFFVIGPLCDLQCLSVFIHDE